MAILRRIFWFMRPLKKAVRYSEEVLYAGWVDPSSLNVRPRR